MRLPADDNEDLVTLLSGRGNHERMSEMGRPELAHDTANFEPVALIDTPSKHAANIKYLKIHTGLYLPQSHSEPEQVRGECSQS